MNRNEYLNRNEIGINMRMFCFVLLYLVCTSKNYNSKHFNNACSLLLSNNNSQETYFYSDKKNCTKYKL